jgi:SAM-dependent methyltransferase
MDIDYFSVPPHNSYYGRASDDDEMRWHRINAVEKVDNIQAVLGGRAIGSVLEIGCGAGTVLSEMILRGAGSSHTGVDVIDPELGGPRAGGVRIDQCYGETLPYADGSFDFVYASHVVEHVLNPRGFVAEAVRVSRGLVYFEVPCEANARTSHRLIQRALDIGHINYFSPDTFLLLLQTCELDVVRFQLFTHGLEFYRHRDSALKARAKMMLKNGLLAANWRIAAKLFTFHCGALIDRGFAAG